MDALRTYLEGPYVSIPISLREQGWHTQAGVPAEPGWYFITTSTPFEVLARQALWQRQYTKKRSQSVADVKNYDLASRCARYIPGLSEFWNTTHVYSGLASSLQARAREHTFADPGTGGLALSRYPGLFEYEWSFSYLTLAQFMPNCPDPTVLLLLGEQVWRARNGWPILCAE